MYYIILTLESTANKIYRNEFMLGEHQNQHQLHQMKYITSIFNLNGTDMLSKIAKQTL